jgi:hypothetical protein
MCLYFLVPCCDVRYDSRIQTMFGSSLPPVVCSKDHVLLCFCVSYRNDQNFAVAIFLVFCVVFFVVVLFVFVMCLVCLRRVSCVSSSCVLFVFVMCLVCLRHVFCLSSSCVLFVFVMCLVCLRHVFCLSSSCVLSVFVMCFVCLRHVSCVPMLPVSLYCLSWLPFRFSLNKRLFNNVDIATWIV